MKKEKQILKILILLPIFLLFFVIVAMASWSAPTGAPPTNNTGGFLHEGSTTQFKEGSLFVDDVVEALSIKLDINSSAKPVCDEDSRGGIWVEDVLGDEFVFLCKWDGSAFLWDELFK